MIVKVSPFAVPTFFIVQQPQVDSAVCQEKKKDTYPASSRRKAA